MHTPRQTTASMEHALKTLGGKKTLKQLRRKMKIPGETTRLKQKTTDLQKPSGWTPRSLNGAVEQIPETPPPNRRHWVSAVPIPARSRSQPQRDWVAGVFLSFSRVFKGFFSLRVVKHIELPCFANFWQLMQYRPYEGRRFGQYLTRLCLTCVSRFFLANLKYVSWLWFACVWVICC